MSEPDAVVISLAERLKSRRTELGISQAQAARELDVARTAYRLWEMEAAKPAPDRWRLIASWLGVSVTTMLLAEDLVSEEEAAMSGVAEHDFGRLGRDWDAVGASKVGGFFVQARSLIEDGAQHGDITPDQAAALASLLDRVEEESPKGDSEAWPRAELRRVFPVSLEAPRDARETVAFIAEDISETVLETACLLTSELMTNSVVHGPEGEAGIELFVQVERGHLHVAVADSSPVAARPTPLSEDGGYGLSLVAALASRWGAGLTDGRNVTWFELALAQPGA